MSHLHANQTASVSVLTVLSDIPVSQSEIADVVAFARQNQSYRFVAMIIGSEAIQKAIDLGLVTCEKGILGVPRTEAPAVDPVAEEVIEPTKPTIDEQIEKLASSSDPTYRQAAVMYQECLGNSWWDEVIKEAEEEMKTTDAIEPILLDPDLKLRQATLNKQVFTGNYKAVRRNAEVLSIGGSLTVRMRRHGKNGCWLLIIEATEDTTSQQVAA
ncbi:MAG: hypothetical protein WAQ98_25685 [Blastocatellia bacterium]